MAEMIEAVEALRTSRDPLLAGPGPDDPLKREAWLRTRQARLAPLAHGLDDVIQRVQGGHAPELEDEAWPSRMMICVTAVERHFDRRADVGEAKAINRDVARDQWPALVAAGRALEALDRSRPWSPTARVNGGGSPGLD